MGKTEQLDSLFEKWRKKYNNNFSKDGIIKEEKWNEAVRKILFILKETNDYPDDLRKYVDEKPWKVLGYWSYGLQNVSKDIIPDFSEAWKNCEDYCRMIGILNLKKSPGGASADPQKIQDIAEDDKENIIEEIKIISPEIIVCGGTFDICKAIFHDVKEFGDRIYRFNKISESVWIDHVHPSQRNIRGDMMYYSLMVYYQKYLQKGLI